MHIDTKSWDPISADEIRSLRNSDFYDASILARAYHQRSNKAVLRYFKNGIIDDKACRFLSPEYLKGRRGRGIKANLQILGREIKRLVKEGPCPKGLFS